MIDNKKWLKFELNSDIAATEKFEIDFCKRFFTIEQWLNLDDVQIIEWTRGIENEPINWVSFQSKYIKEWWSWSQIESSLKQILKHHSKYYPGLEKVFIYVKKIWSDKYLEEKNKEDWILQKLENIGVKVEIYAKWEKIWTDDRYRELRSDFEIKQDASSELKMIEKYIDNLFLEQAQDNLRIIKNKFNSLEKKQQSNFYLYLARTDEFTNLFKEIDKYDNTLYYENLIKTNNYLNNEKTLLNKAIWLYWLGDKEESKKIIEDLYNKNRFNENIYGFYLLVKKDEYDTFGDFIKIVDKKYESNLYVRWMLWNIYKEMWGEHIYAFEEFYKQDYKKIEKLYEKIIYFRLWSQYLEQKHSIYNLSEDAKQEYIELEKFMDSFIADFEWKKLDIEIQFLNIKALISSKVKWTEVSKKDADYFFKKALERKDSWIIRVNKVLNLLSIEWNDNQDIHHQLKYIVDNLDFYLEQESWNPNKSILYQVHVLLSQEYFLESRSKIDLSDEYKNKWFRLLQEFKDNYYDKADLIHRRNFWIVDIQSDENTAKDKVVDYLEQDNCIIYNLLAFGIMKDTKYIDVAYELYINWETDSIESVIQLADIFLLKLGDERKFFDIIDEFLNDLWNKEYFKNYIITGINLSEIDKVDEKLEAYKKKNGVDYDYIMLKSYFENRKWNKEKAIDIINGFQDLNKHIDLLYWKSNFQYNLWDEDYKNTLNKLCKIWEKTDFKSFSIKDKIDFISSYSLVKIKKSITICYDFLQEDIEDKYLLELKKIYFKIHLNSEQDWLKFNNDFTTKDSVITIKDLSNNDTQIVCMDWYSKKIFGFDKVLNHKQRNYNELIWRKLWDEITNLFWDKFGIEQKHKIIEIKHKYDYLQWLMFSKYSDDVLNAVKIQVPTKNGETDLSNFLDMMDFLWKQETDRKKYIDDNFTNKWLLTFKVLKHFYWKSYTEIYYQQDFRVLLSDQLFKLKEWEDIKDIIIDPSSVISIFELWLESILKNNFNIYVSQSTFESFNNDLTEFKANPKSPMSLFSDWKWNHGKMEFTEQDYEKKEKHLKKVVNFLKDDCKRVESGLILSSNWWMDDILGNEFYSSLLIAKEKWYYLFSDEQVLRRMARNKENNIRAFWIESLLIYLNLNKKIYPEFLLNSYIKLLNLWFRGVLINTVMIHYLLIKENVKDLNIVISYVKNEYEDINFIVSSLISSMNQIHNYKWNINNMGFTYTDNTKKYYFEILYRIILKYFDKKDIDKLFYQLVDKEELPEIKFYLDSLNS